MTSTRIKVVGLVALIILVMLASQAIAQSGRDPLSSMVAVSYVGSQYSDADNAADYVKDLVALYDAGELEGTGIQFPLANATTDDVRALEGFQTSIVASWLEPLTWENSNEAPRYGANNDYIAYFGDDWDEVGAPQFNGSDTEGWIWTNFEYISGNVPTPTSAPTGQHMTLAKFLVDRGILTNDVTAEVWSQADVDTYIDWYKRQLGGAWFRVVQNPATKQWSIDRSADNLRYDATNNTLAMVSGLPLSDVATDDTGEALPEGVVPGIMGDCSGGQSPWGTILTAEENVQDYYGDLEACWSGTAFVAEAGCDAGTPIEFTFSAAEASDFGQHSDLNTHNNRDFYGYLTEIDPGVPPMTYYQSLNDDGEGIGHRKIGAMGRARWENATFVVDSDWNLIDGQPIVIYGANDRRDGRIYKFVSAEPYTAGMSEAETRALIDEGTVYVSHFAGLDNETGITVGGETPTIDNPAVGEWLELSLNSTDIAPNAVALGTGEETIGEVLQDNEWNNIGGFTTNEDVLRAMFTAAAKAGVKGLNRPEDLEWNANDISGTPLLYIAFTYHSRQNSLDPDGLIYDPAVFDEESPKREDSTGAIFALQEENPEAPSQSAGFTYWSALLGTEGDGPFDVARPDNMMLDADGGVWFGTDGNFSKNGKADALYYLDLDPSHTNTYGLPFRVVAGPSDSEATGPAFSSEMGTIFFNVQHPGEGVYSSWPMR